MASGPRSPYKTNWNKFEDAMYDVVQKEVCRVFLWLYQGSPKYVGDYLDEIPKGKNGLYKSDIANLDNKEPPTRMDITLLYSLLQRTCGLPDRNDHIWADPIYSDRSSLEHTLYLIKEERNILSHDRLKKEAQMSDKVLNQKLDYLRRLCADLLVGAARRCGRLNEIVKLNDNMETKLQEIRVVTSDKFIRMAKEEKLKTAPTKMADEWYQQPVFRRQGQPVTLDDLLQWRAPDGTASTSLLVTGEAGVGKSSLCRYLEECWLRPRGGGRRDPLQRYQLVLLIHCRDVNTSDVVRLLQEELLPETASWCSSVVLSEFLCTVPILWVFDGLDEATTDATRLIDSLFRKRQQNITVLVTSKPEYGRDFSSRYSDDMTHINVNLCGVDPFLAIQNIVRSGKCDEDTTRHAKSLMEDFKKLDRRVQQELQNPLKLRLILQDWEDMRTSSLQVFDLSRLYQKITNTQKKSLSDSLSKERLTEAEATRKVKKWFSFLCESAFSLVRYRKVFDDNIRKEMLSKLEDKCDDLGISSSQCLSVFLSCTDSMFSSGNSGYTFYHDTQVHYLSALHVDSVMKESNDLHSDTLRLFNISTLQEQSSRQPPLEHCLNVLLFLISLTSDSTSDDVLKMMIKLLLNAIPLRICPWMWFEVAIKASYEDRTMREIGRVIPKRWVVFDPYVEAARRLLEYSQPDEVHLLVFCNPEEVKELQPLVCRLASLPVDLLLKLRHYTLDLFGKATADRYLEVICCEDSPCVLVAFEGHLSDKGYDLLKHPKISDSCEFLRIKVKSIKSLEILCECVKGFESLEIIAVIAMKQIPSTSAKLEATTTGLWLPCMTDETAKDTAKFTARLCQSYNELVVYDMTYKGIKSFLKNLVKKCVKANNFLGRFEEGSFAPLNVDFGSLPLQCSVEHFRQQWHIFRGLACKALRLK